MPKSLLSSEVKAALDEAIHAELYASNLYLRIANQLQRLGYFGAQAFFLKGGS
jgi:ferritin